MEFMWNYKNCDIKYSNKSARGNFTTISRNLLFFLPKLKIVTFRITKPVSSFFFGEFFDCEQPEIKPSFKNQNIKKLRIPKKWKYCENIEKLRELGLISII